MITTGTVVVRVAAASDDAALARLDIEAFSPQSGFPSSVSAVGSPFFSVRNPPEAHLVADDAGVLLGYLRLKQQLDDVPENAHVLAIHGLAVAPGARRRGVGTALMNAAEDAARSRGARKLSLRMFGGNDTARALYENLGYTVEGVMVAEFLIDGGYVDDILMTKRLC